MSSDSCVFLLVLPELTFLILINLILIFALLFSHFESGKLSAAEFKLSGVETKFDSAYHGFVVTPLLQADAVGKLSALIFVHVALIYLNSHQVWTSGFGLTGDDLGRFMSVFLCFSAACALSLSLQSLKRFSRYEFTLLLSLSLLGMLCLIKSSSFLSFYLSIELQSLSFYMLAAMRSRTESSSEAGLKYFILSAFSSAMLLLGMAVCYGAIGSQNFSDLTHALNHFSGTSPLEANLWVGCGCIAVSLLFKLGAAPFHAWIADVYEGSHTSITAWFAITAKIAVATALIRLNGCGMLFNLLTFVALTSLVVGSLSAMRQVKLKRLIAFSAVANAGWFVLALVTGQWQLMVVHLLVYTLQSINLFSVFTLPLFRSHPSLAYLTRSSNLTKTVSADSVDHAADSSGVKYLSDLHQIVKVNPSLALAVSLSMFSLAGMPPLAGFYSKYLILSAVTQAEMYGVLSLALAVAILSAFYYLRVVKTAYFSGAENASYGGQWWFTLRPQPINAWITSFTTATTLLFFLNPDYFCALLFVVN